MSEEYPCPFCGENIKKIAKLCRYCRSEITPIATDNKETVAVQPVSTGTKKPRQIDSFKLYYGQGAVFQFMYMYYAKRNDLLALSDQAQSVLAIYLFIGLIISWAIAKKQSGTLRWLLCLHFIVDIYITIVFLGIPVAINYSSTNNSDFNIWAIGLIALLIFRSWVMHYLFTPAAEKWFKAR